MPPRERPVELRIRNALFLPTLEEKLANLKNIIDAGANVNMTITPFGAQGTTQIPLISYVILKNYGVSIIEYLIEKGADVNKEDDVHDTPIIYAANSGKLYYVNELLKHNVNVNHKGKLNRTALMHAAKQGLMMMCKELIKKGGNVNDADENGMTPLLDCIDGDHENIFKFLLTKGADINAKTPDGKNALMHAITRKVPIDSPEQNKILASLLLNRDIRINEKDKEGNAAIHILINRHDVNYSVSILEKMINIGADINIKNNLGMTPLILCVNEDNENIFAVLIEKGADINAKINDGYTVLILALRFNKQKVLNKILENPNWGVNVNEKNKNGYTALHFVVLSHSIDENDKFNIVEKLINMGADINILDSQGDPFWLYLADPSGVKGAVKLTLLRYILNRPEFDATIRHNGRTIIELAMHGNLFSPEINKLIIRILDPEGLTAPPITKWKGLTRSDIGKFDTIFEDNAKNYSCCPVCLEYVERSEACMYMKHNCSSSGKYYHKDLYNKYKNTEGFIAWCTICGRIASGHRHHKLRMAYAKVPDDFNKALETGTGDPFENDCSKSSGGGGPTEKLARFRRLREYALELQDEVGKMPFDEAMNELVEETWNAPLVRKRTLPKMMQEKKWNIPLESFMENIRQEAVDPATLPNIRRPANNADALKPEMSGEGANFMGEEGPLIKFRHRQPDGSINDHAEYLITAASLEDFIRRTIDKPWDDEFGHCYMYPGQCKARLYPEEIKDFVPEDLYNQYRIKFNEKFRVAAGGALPRSLKKIRVAPGATNIFVEATDALCVLPPRSSKRNTRKKSGNGRPRRSTRRRRAY